MSVSGYPKLKSQLRKAQLIHWDLLGRVRYGLVPPITGAPKQQYMRPIVLGFDLTAMPAYLVHINLLPVRFRVMKRAASASVLA